MRSKRGLIASIGAATSLILAGTLALASVSTVIAFRGWPGVHNAPLLTAPAILASAPTDHKAAKGSASITVPTAPAVAAHHVSAGRASAHSPSTSSAGAQASAPPNVPTSPVVTAAKPAPTDQGGHHPSAPAAAKKGPLTTTVRKVGDGVGNTVENTGKTLGDVVTPISPTLGQVVTNATDAVGELVKKATGLVGQILDAVTHQASAPAPPPPAESPPAG